MGLKMRNTATRLIQKHGQSGFLMKPGVPIPDGGGGETTGPRIPYPILLVTTKFSDELKLTAQSMVSVEDLRFLVSVEGLTVEPDTADEIKAGDLFYRIMGVTPLTPAGDVLFYEIHGRRL